MPLNLSELKQWSPEIADLAEATRQAADTHTGSAEFYRSLAAMSRWEGRAAEAARAAMEATARDHDAVAETLGKAAASMKHAGEEAEAVTATIKGILDDAAAPPDVYIDESTNTVTPPDTGYMTEEYAAKVAAKVTDLRQRISDVLADGARLDADLAGAIATAAGSPQPATKAPSSIGDLLVPTGVGQQPAPAPRDLDSALEQVAGGPVAAGLRGSVPLDPAKVEQFKALTRQMLQRQGLPPDQIEQRLNAAVAAAQRPLTPHAPPKADPMPPPGFGEGFADRWFSTEEGFRDLLGQNGLDAFKDSWEGLAKGTADRLTDPVGAVAGDVQDALDSPSAAYYLGEKSADAAVTAPGLMFGGEAALARAAIVDDVGGAGAIPEALIDHPGPNVEHPVAHSPLIPEHSSIGDAPSHQAIPTPAGDLHPGPLPHDSPMFDGYDPTPPGPEFTNSNGGLIYPDDSSASKPYAIPGTVIDNAEIPHGTVIDRFGHPGGSWLSPDGTPFAERALPPDSLNKSNSQYIVGNPENLPIGYRIEESRVAPWFDQPGGGTQYRIIGPDGRDAPVQDLIESRYLKEVGA